VCPCYHVQSAPADGGGRIPLGGCVVSALRFRPAFLLRLAGHTLSSFLHGSEFEDAEAVTPKGGLHGWIDGGDVAVVMDVPWCYAGGEESVSGAPLAGTSRRGQCPNRVVETRLGDVSCVRDQLWCCFSGRDPSTPSLAMVTPASVVILLRTSLWLPFPHSSFAEIPRPPWSWRWWRLLRRYLIGSVVVELRSP
jgi:hypothetical protein